MRGSGNGAALISMHEGFERSELLPEMERFYEGIFLERRRLNQLGRMPGSMRAVSSRRELGAAMVCRGTCNAMVDSFRSCHLGNVGTTQTGICSLIAQQQREGERP